MGHSVGCRGYRRVGGVRFARGANAHLNDDEAVAKMGHPACVAPSSVAGLTLGCLAYNRPAGFDVDIGLGQRIFGLAHLTLRERGELWRLTGGDVGLDESERRWRLGPWRFDFMPVSWPFRC
jgi:hypothetical protein